MQVITERPALRSERNYEYEEDSAYNDGRRSARYHLDVRPGSKPHRRRRTDVRHKNIIQNAVNSPIHKTLVAAVKAAGLVDTLSGPGPFTVFAPTDDAFAKLPAGTVDTLVKPENKATLVKILTYHVVPGKITSKELIKMIKKGGGTYSAKTVEGGSLSFSLDMGKVKITDEKGGSAYVTTADVMQSNGVIHVIDTVLMPN